MRRQTNGHRRNLESFFSVTDEIVPRFDTLQERIFGSWDDFRKDCEQKLFELFAGVDSIPRLLQAISSESNMCVLSVGDSYHLPGSRAA